MPRSTILVTDVLSIANDFDCAVLDQWGVLHQGERAFDGAISSVRRLKSAGKRIVVLSNSGKRAQPNLQRLHDCGIPVDLIDDIVTSGEVLWHEFQRGSFTQNGEPVRALFVTRSAGEETEWLRGLESVHPVDDVSLAEVVVLIGTPDTARDDDYDSILKNAATRRLPLICANPDQTSPRPGGLVLSPGFFAARYSGLGGDVRIFGKPFPSVFDEVKRRHPDLAAGRFLMIGDSIEHDVCGARRAGMKTMLVRSGLFAGEFASANSPGGIQQKITELVDRIAPRHWPDYSIHALT